MLYAITAILKPGMEDKLPALQSQFTEHLSQPFRRIRLAGGLSGPEGTRRGFLMFVEAKTMAEAETYLHQSPLYRAKLYETVDVAAFDVLVGRLD